MMHADVANEVIDAVNECDAVIQALKAATVSPDGAGAFLWADANMVLKLTGGVGGTGGTPGIITGAVNGVPATATIPFITPWAEI